MSVTKSIELIGKSTVSWDDAIKLALAEASKTLRGIKEIRVVSVWAEVEDNKISNYLARVKVLFEVEKERD